MYAIPKFTQVDALPGPKCKPAVAYWNGQRSTDQSGFDMSWHIIRPFYGVDDEWHVFRHYPVHIPFKINTNIWIGIFVDANSCRGVLYEEVAKPHIR